MAGPGFSGGAQAIALGAYHSCATDGNGGLSCWGANSSYQLGDGTNQDRWSPVGISSLTRKVQSIALGESHSCALQAGALYCWGDNTYGQLGSGSYDPSPVPSLVLSPGFAIQSFSSGRNQVCATDGTSGVACWGQTYSYKVGRIPGTFTFGTVITEIKQDTPTLVAALAGPIYDLAVGGHHVCARDASGVQCFGSGNPYGALTTVALPGLPFPRVPVSVTTVGELAL